MISDHELLIGEKSIYGPYNNEENDNRLNAMALNAASIRNVSPLLRCSSLAAAWSAAIAFEFALLAGARLFTQIRHL